MAPPGVLSSAAELGSGFSGLGGFRGVTVQNGAFGRRCPLPDGGIGSQLRARQRGKHVLRAARDLAYNLAEAGGEDGPEVGHSRVEVTRLRAHTA